MMTVNRSNCEGQSEAINNNQKRRGSYKTGRHCSMMMSISQCLNAYWPNNINSGEFKR